jgi:hypothetical protein
MSFDVFFSFSAGLSQPLFAPKGTLHSIMEYVAHIESTLKLTSEKYGDNPAHWTRQSKRFDGIDDKTLCREVSAHNAWVRTLYRQFSDWSKNPVRGGEKITPQAAQKFWHALERLDVPVSRWTDDYFRERMESIYEAMRGRESDGATFDAKPLSPEQANAVLNLFSFLDVGDIRLEVPVGCDYLASSAEGEYSWCEKCGAIAEDEVAHRSRFCRKPGGCPIREQCGCEE